MGGKGKCLDCGGSGRQILGSGVERKCIWCGGSGRMSYKYFYWYGVAVGMAQQKNISATGNRPRLDSWTKSLLDTLTDYGSPEALEAATSEPKIFDFIDKARQGHVDSLLEVVAAVRNIGTSEDINAFFDKYVSYTLDEVAPIRYG